MQVICSQNHQPASRKSFFLHFRKLQGKLQPLRRFREYGVRPQPAPVCHILACQNCSETADIVLVLGTELQPGVVLPPLADIVLLVAERMVNREPRRARNGSPLINNGLLQQGEQAFFVSVLTHFPDKILQVNQVQRSVSRAAGSLSESNGIQTKNGKV